MVTKASYLIHSLRCTSTGMGPRVGTRYDDMTILKKIEYDVVEMYILIT